MRIFYLSRIWEIHEVNLNWDFKDRIVFAYLGKKQDSRLGIKHYRGQSIAPDLVEQISKLSLKAVGIKDLPEFQHFINEHESIIARHLKLQKVKDLYFSDFDGSIKSLGAWGGDFILVASPLPFENVRSYFESKGLKTLFKWDEIVLETNSNL